MRRSNQQTPCKGDCDAVAEARALERPCGVVGSDRCMNGLVTTASKVALGFKTNIPESWNARLPQIGKSHGGRYLERQDFAGSRRAACRGTTQHTFVLQPELTPLP